MNIALIRTMDSQGRIVIPAEIRKQMKLSDGDALELENVGMELLLRKCPTHLNGKEEMASYLSVLYSVIHCGIAICSEAHILVSAGIYLPEGTPVTEELAELVADGQELISAENCLPGIQHPSTGLCFFPDFKGRQRAAGTSSLFQNRTAFIRDGIGMR
jgi:AbrB family transcriptional regulator (stage V sporulation protein T)